MEADGEWPGGGRDSASGRGGCASAWRRVFCSAALEAGLVGASALTQVEVAGSHPPAPCATVKMMT